MDPLAGLGELAAHPMDCLALRARHPYSVAVDSQVYARAFPGGFVQLLNGYQLMLIVYDVYLQESHSDQANSSPFNSRPFFLLQAELTHVYFMQLKFEKAIST